MVEWGAILHTKRRLNSAFIPLYVVIFIATTVHAQTSVGLSLYGAFSGATNGNGVQESPSNSAGGLIEVRHISNPIFGFEGTYSYNRSNQVYRAQCSGPACTTVVPATVSANAHELTADWVPSIHISNLRPFGVLGAGLLLNVPDSGQTNSTNSNKAVYVYGAGLDWGLLPHLGLRFQYRGNLYKTPDVTRLYTSTDAFTHTAEPMIGAYFSF
jgi:opacity protein-like surface antigen